MSLVDDYLDPAVEKQFRFKDGGEYKVRVRPRKGAGFTDRSVIGFHPVAGKYGAGVRLSIVRQIAADGPEEPGGGDLLFRMTKRDAEAVCAWLDSLN